MTTTYADHATVQNSGNDFLHYTNSSGSVVFSVGSKGGIQMLPTKLTGSADALSAHGCAVYACATAGVDAMTLAAPTAGTDDGAILIVFSTTANAHTITATSLLNNGGAGVPYTTATFAAHAGASITLMAYNALWYVVASTNVTLS